MKTNFLKISAALALTGLLSACVVAPQPMGYRMTSNVLPTYVNGQYVGMQPNTYVVPAAAAQQTVPVQSSVPVQSPAATNGQPVYIQSAAPSVVYVQGPAPVPYYAPTYYGYDPYDYYGAPWFGGVGIGIGLDFVGRGWGGGHGGFHGGGRGHGR